MQLFLVSNFVAQLGRFLSNPNLGCEKLLISAPVGGMCAARPKFSAAEVTGDPKDLVDPMGLLLVKGWTRSFAAWVVMVSMYDNSEIYEAWAREPLHGACWLKLSTACPHLNET